jgi:hypothetical protein
MNLFDKENQWRFTKIAEQKRNKIKLEGEDALIAEVMNQHPEFDTIWPLGEFSAQPREIGGMVVNPFVHTALHVIIEQQIEKERPPAIAETFKKLLSQGKERHEASHQIATIYANHYFTTFRKGQPFDELSYVLDVQTLVDQPDSPF